MFYWEAISDPTISTGHGVVFLQSDWLFKIDQFQAAAAYGSQSSIQMRLISVPISSWWKHQFVIIVINVWGGQFVACLSIWLASSNELIIEPSFQIGIKRGSNNPLLLGTAKKQSHVFYPSPCGKSISKSSLISHSRSMHLLLYLWTAEIPRDK